MAFDSGEYDYGNLTAPHVGIQWKGTDVCFDFFCACGSHGHYDGYNAYAVQCDRCGAKYDMTYSVELKPYTDVFEPVIADNHDGARWLDG